MNPKRLILAIVAVFAGVWITDFLIHGVWLKSAYANTASLWRPESEMVKHMPWLLLGQFIYAATFVVLWAKGLAAQDCLRCACMYGVFMALFSQAYTLVLYAVQPFPGSIAANWFVSGILQGLVMGLIVFFVYKPKIQIPKPTTSN